MPMSGSCRAGDHDIASRVELTLPETGVCGGAGLFDDAGAQSGGEGGCCSPTSATDEHSVPVATPPTVHTASQLVQIGVPNRDRGSCRPSGG